MLNREPVLSLVHLSKKGKPMTPEELQHDHHANPANANVKPAYKTTEFWLSLAAMVVSMLLSSGVLSPEDDGQAKVLQILGVISTLLAAMGYTASRTSVKNRSTEGAAAVAIAKLAAGDPGRPTTPSEPK